MIIHHRNEELRCMFESVGDKLITLATHTRLQWTGDEGRVFLSTLNQLIELETETEAAEAAEEEEASLLKILSNLDVFLDRCTKRIDEMKNAAAETTSSSPGIKITIEEIQRGVSGTILEHCQKLKLKLENKNSNKQTQYHGGLP